MRPASFGARGLRQMAAMVAAEAEGEENESLDLERVVSPDARRAVRPAPLHRHRHGRASRWSFGPRCRARQPSRHSPCPRPVAAGAGVPATGAQFAAVMDKTRIGLLIRMAKVYAELARRGSNAVDTRGLFV